MQAERLITAVVEHGNQLGANMAYFKNFSQAQRGKQEEFLRALQVENDGLQRKALRAAQWSAGAAIAAALAALLQVYLALNA